MVKEKITSLLNSVVNNDGYDLVDWHLRREYGQWYLRVYIDKPTGGITLDECQQVSEKISLFLDREDVIPYRYNLEVSSPGIKRLLVTEKDFTRNLTRWVRVFLTVPVVINNKNKTELYGQLNQVAENKLYLTEPDGTKLEVLISAVKFGKIVPQI